MAQLKSAGFFGWLGSVFFPKKMEVHVRTETLPGGQVQVTPSFTIDGHEVPPDLITPSKNQHILGYNVVLDQAVAALQKQTQGKQIRLSRSKAGDYLSQLGRSGIDIRSRDGKVACRVESVKPDITLKLEADDSLKVNSELITSDGIVLDKPQSLDDLKPENGWYALGDDLIRVETSNTPLDKVLLTKDGNGSITGDGVPRFLKLVQRELEHIGSVEKNDPLKELSVLSGKPENRAKVEGDADAVVIHPSLIFPGTQGRLYEQTADVIEQMEKKGGGFRRVSEGWVEVSPEAIGKFRRDCREMSEKLGAFPTIRGADIPKALSKLQETRGRDGWSSPWTVYFSEAVRNGHRLIDAPANVEFRLNIVERDGRSLLELDPIYNHDRFRLTHDETDRANKSGEEWVRRQDAWIRVDKEKYRKIEAGIEQLKLERGPTGFTFPASQREQVIDLFSILGSIQHSKAFSEFLAKLADFKRIEDVPLPRTLRSEINFRPYQKHGYNWLAFLHRFGLNGILADDMGLGKTLQTLAVVQRAKEIGKSPFPSLVVCPTSVVNNWKSEIHKFFQDCCVIVYTGNYREKKLRRVQESITATTLGLASPFVITSYGVALLDHETLNQIPWLYVIVDEGHNIKNPDAQRTRAIKTINGQHKLALTGTPIQNSLEELWYLFDYAMPGFLGTRTAFRDQYGRNGRVNWDVVRGGKVPLKERVHPFIMRRMKEDVEPDLPSKIIIDRKVELTPLQVRLYKQVIESPDYQRLVKEVDEKGVSRSKVLILATLMKLRAICNHPVLADRDRGTAAAQHDESGKLEDLKELITEVIESEHRALLFSQSTQMLDIIQRLFANWQIATIRLDGSTPPNRRSELVDEFNRNSAIHCFLISTKAGGTGLNLTGADTVIFYDHDWNPANDKQAQDRAYRIGQTKPVTVYRLISKGTIEEKILERQFAKQTLADEIIGADEEGFKDLSKEELLALFTLDQDDDWSIFDDSEAATN